MDVIERDWAGLLFTIFGIILPIAAQQWFLHRASKREREAENRKLAEDAEARDKKLRMILSEFPPHAHCERVGKALTEDGIRYPKEKFNGH